MIIPVPPFDFLQTSTRNKFMKVMIVLALLMTAVFFIMGRDFNSEAAPSGIISFEFARTVAQAQAILDSWNAQTKLRVAFSLGLDFLYPIVYASAISLGCVWAAERTRPSAPRVADIGLWLAWGAWLAALLDYIENIALVTILFGSTASFWPLLAYICAFIKFTLIIIAILYVLGGWLLFRSKAPHTAVES